MGSSPIFRPIRKSPRFRAGFFFFCRWLRPDSPSAALCREPGPGVRKDKSRLYSRVHGRGYASFAGKGLREILFRRGGKRLARPACSLSSLSIDGALSAVVICLASERGPRSCPAGGGFSLRAGNALGLQTGRPCQSRAFCVQNIPSRSVAQHGSAPALGAGGRWFESSRSDQNNAEGFQHSRSPFFLPVVLPFAAFGLLPRISIPAAPLPSPAPPRTHLPLFPLLQGTSRLSSKQSLFRPVAPPMLLGTTRNRRFGICVLT